MRPSYVRFVCDAIDKDSGRRRGVFQAAFALLDANELPADDREALDALRGWFSAHLAKPDRFARGRRTHAAHRAISWFKASATEHVRRIRAMCAILNAHGIRTEMITSARPGYVVYEDEHQVAALPFAETPT